MRIEIRRLTSWNEVLNAARFTQRKEPLDREPSIKFKKAIIKAEHSPLRCLTFSIDFYDIPNYVSVHLVRHVHAQPFVSTSRPDIDGKQVPREEQRKTDPCNMRLVLNAQEIINISKVRLCNRAEAITKEVWRQVIDTLRMQEPELADACVPSCIYRGFCPEMKCCGFVNSRQFNVELSVYRVCLNSKKYERD
jgi:hypothetical protein